MYRIGLAILVCLIWACKGKEEKASKTTTPGGGSGNAAFSNRFPSVSVPYQLSDTSLLLNKDTTTLPASELLPLLPDSTLQKLFGKASAVKFSPLARAETKNKESYYVVKATAGGKKAALLLVFDKAGQYSASLPFLVPDENEGTTQVTVLDKSFMVTRNVTQRSGNEVTGEGKEVLSYDAREKRFSLIMTDVLNDNPAVVANPIDTFPKTGKFAGDYYRDKKNLVAIRDGRHPNQILVYIHTENKDGDCKGELKGEFVLISSTRAVYRQGGDPCILGLSFAGNSVSIHEESGCGNYRGLDCPFNNSFTRKKEEKPKESSKSSKRPKAAR